MTAGNNEIQSGFINALTMGPKILSPGNIPTQEALKAGLTSVTAGVSLNEAAVALGALAVAGTAYGLYKGYEAIEDHFKKQNKSHELYEQDCEHNVVNFIAKTKYPEELAFFNAFIELLQAGQGHNGTLYRLANIHYKESTETDPRQSFAIMNMASFDFITQAHIAEGDHPTLDHARNSLDDFLEVVPQRLLRKAALRRTHTVTGTLFTRHLSGKEIQQLNILRFMIMVFINIALNSKYVPDLSIPNNIPLDDRAANAFCGTVTELIDKILTPDAGNKNFLYLKQLEYREEFLEFLQDLKERMQRLQEGYRSRLLHQLNMSVVVTSSQELLKSVNEAIMHTLFFDNPDATNATLLCLVEEVAGDFVRFPDIWRTVSGAFKSNQLPRVLGLNYPLSTAIDLIGLFASYDVAGRAHLLAHLSKGAPDVGRSLQRLDTYFIAPFDKHHEKYNTTLKSSPSKGTMLSPQQNAASAYLMSLIALVVESAPQALEHPLHQQLVALNQLQFQRPGDAVFSFKIFEQLGFDPQTLGKIQSMFGNIYMFLDSLRTEIAFKDLLQTNKSLLMNTRVRVVTKKAAMTLSQASQGWSRSVESLSERINIGHDHKSPANRRKYFGHMLHESKGLMRRFELITQLTADITRVLDAPGYTEILEGEMKAAVASLYTSHEESQADRDYIMELLSANWSKANTPRTSAHLAAANAASSSGSTSTAAMRTIATGETSGTLLAGDTSQLVEIVVPRTPPNSIDARSEDAPSFMLQTVLCILKTASAFLLIIGVLVLLSFTLGMPYLPILAALTSAQVTGCTIAAEVSIVTGVVGLAASYFFQPKVSDSEELEERQENHASCWASCYA